MSEDNGASTRISISQETLRTEIRLANAELELRIRKFLQEELEKKASALALAQLVSDHEILKQQVVLRDGPLFRDLERLEEAQEKFQQGEFTTAQKNSIANIVNDTINDINKTVWSKRDKTLAILGTIFTGASVLANIILVVRLVIA